MTRFDFSDHYELRDLLATALEDDLVGPTANKPDLIHDAPLTAYVAGVLYPVQSGQIAPGSESAGSLVSEAELDLPADDSERGSFPEPTVALADTRKPSTMGLTFSVDISGGPRLCVAPEAVKYRPAADDGVTAVSDEQANAMGRAELLRDRVWVRVPLDLKTVTIDTARAHSNEVAVGADLFVAWRVRTPVPGSSDAAVTVTLINRSPSVNAARDLTARFRCGFRVTASPGQAVFTERRVAGDHGVSDIDLQSYRLLYRHAKTFAVGHGCGAMWQPGGEQDRKDWVSTAVLPRARVRVAQSNPTISSPALRMRDAAQMATGRLVDSLRTFVEGYSDWVEDQREALDELPDERLRATAEDHLELCAQAVRRMNRGIELIAAPEGTVREAFRLMQEAMNWQREAGTLRGSGTLGPPTGLGEGTWHPFQLGFILLCIEGIADPQSDDRELVDLLWFPTGGGKTEAYLGLIAFTIFLRRLRGDGAGVTVLMRYTLRLLTIQQFARAALLICSCERLRGRDGSLGDEPISIGLWVGRAGTPNTIEEARKALSTGPTSQTGNPQQLEVCPWCGTELTLRDHHRLVGERLVIACGTSGCEFADGLPVVVVDQQIYSERPTLLVGTADKFAALPWRDECRALFNLGTDDAPPALVVQDELHLISGPLGTLAGLYEAAIDLLCEAEGPAPKVIASTATIRRADHQSRALFGRPMRQFPPPGTDSRDSYFAVEAEPSKGADRLYIGVLAPAASHATLMIRAYARVLQSVSTAPYGDETKDAYWTLLGYFNSLRVLGGALLQVQDDVRDRIEHISRGEVARTVHAMEMTSRVSSDEIPAKLKDMERSLSDGDAFDVVLATNMISVGLDVPRLGLMAVMGQPQSTSEYIQATSRVGRRWPGLVIALFNGNKSRDRSHYENFGGYHSALYRHVESTSVTPFSPRARDRALHAVFIAVARLTIPELGGNEGAASVNRVGPELDRLAEAIVRRAERTLVPSGPEGLSEEQHEDLREVRAHLNEIARRWRGRAGEPAGLKYRADRESDGLLTAATAVDSVESFPTGYSLRDVDAETTFRVIR